MDEKEKEVKKDVEKAPNNNDNDLLPMKKWVFTMIIIVITIGVIVPFGAQFLLPMFFPTQAAEAEVWNTYVSIILGLVATILSIVSMIMGFKNYEDTLVAQDRHFQLIQELGLMKNEISSNIALLRIDYLMKSYQPKSDETWDTDPIDQ